MFPNRGRYAQQCIYIFTDIRDGLSDDLGDLRVSTIKFRAIREFYLELQGSQRSRETYQAYPARKYFLKDHVAAVVPNRLNKLRINHVSKTKTHKE